MLRRCAPRFCDFLLRNYSNAYREPYRQVYPVDILKKYIENVRIESVDDWRKFRESILNSGVSRQITPTNIDAMTIGTCTSMQNYKLADSYLEFLKSEQIPLNVATIGKYLKLIYLKNKDVDIITKEDSDSIKNLYSELTKSYTNFDRTTTEAVVSALSITDDWRKCSEIIEKNEAFGSLGSITYSVFVAAAFKNGDEELAWKYLYKMIELQVNPINVVFTTYFKHTKNANNQIEYLEKMLNFIQENHLVLHPEIIEDVVVYMKRAGVNLKISKIQSKGICNICKQKLKKFELTDQEFNELKEMIISKVIIGKNVFVKTTPAELANFKDFVKDLGQHDVVVDGLNVAYSAGSKQSLNVFARNVVAVVSHFVGRDKKVLVLGRDHMRKYPANTWKYIKNNATVFLTQNISQDDPYLLYCALHSGKDTIIVTRDLMRSHRFLLPTLHYKNLFELWLTQRQYQLIRIMDSGKPIFKTMNNFSAIAQKNGRYWHIPFSTKTKDSETTWVCLEVDNR